MALLYNSKGYADKNFSATRLCWSKGIGGGDAFMKLCLPSSGRETRPAKGEPAQAGSKPCADSVVSLQRAGKYQRPVWWPSQGQKGIGERAIMASQWSAPPWQRPRRRPCRRTSPPQAPSCCRLPPATANSYPRGLGPRWHPIQQDLSQAPDMIGQLGCHRWRTGAPLLRGARAIGGQGLEEGLV